MFLGLGRPVQLAALAAVGAGCLAVAACGPSSSPAAGDAYGASASPASTVDPLADLTASQVEAKLMDGAKAAASISLNGSITDSDGAETIKFAIKPGKGCTGTVGIAGKGSVKLTEIGDTVYLNPDNKFWAANAGAKADAVVALVGGRYIKVPSSDKSLGSLASLCDTSQMFATDGKADKLTKGKVTTLAGTRVLTLNDTTDGSVAYVTDTSEPQLVQVTGPKGAGKVTVTYGAPVTLTPPPASQVIDGTKLGM